MNAQDGLTVGTEPALTTAVAVPDGSAGPAAPDAAAGKAAGVRRTTLDRLGLSLWLALNNYGEALSHRQWTWVAIGLVLYVGALDILSSPQAAYGAFYLVPAVLTGWFAGKRAGMTAAVVSASVWVLVGLVKAPKPLSPVICVWNAETQLGICVLAALILAQIRGFQQGLEDQIQQAARELKAETARRLAEEQDVVTISHREQQRIAHDLHDGLGQELGGLAIRAKLLADQLAEEGNGLADEAESFVELLNQSTARTRALSHLLDPVGVESGGLRPALRRLADESARAFALTTVLDAPETLPEIPPEMAVHLYRIVQEAIYNAAKHGHATRVRVHVRHEAGVLTLNITNDGATFKPGAAEAGNGQGMGGMGLRIMRYRAEALGARLQIKAAPDGGCQVSCSLPLTPLAPS